MDTPKCKRQHHKTSRINNRKKTYSVRQVFLKYDMESTKMDYKRFLYR